MEKLDFQDRADIGAAVYDALGRRMGRPDSAIDSSLQDRQIIGGRVEARLRDFGLEIVRVQQE